VRVVTGRSLSRYLCCCSEGIFFIGQQQIRGLPDQFAVHLCHPCIPGSIRLFNHAPSVCMDLLEGFGPMDLLEVSRPKNVLKVSGPMDLLEDSGNICHILADLKKYLGSHSFHLC
jgi:hypothetical protein